MAQVVKHVHGAKAPSIQSTAQRMLRESSGDMGAAVDRFVGYARNFPHMADELMRIGARKLLNEVPQTERAGILRERSSVQALPFVKAPFRMNKAALASQERLRKQGGYIKSALLDMPYTIGGKSQPLRLWTGVEVRGLGETQLLAGASTVRNARFLIAVGSAAGDKKVGDVLDGSAVEKIKREAESSDV